MLKNLIASTFNNSWKDTVMEYRFVSDYDYFEAIKAVTADLADFQEEARQENTYIKTVKISFKGSEVNVVKEFHYETIKNLDKDICEFFAEVIPGNKVIGTSLVEVIFA